MRTVRPTAETDAVLARLRTAHPEISDHALQCAMLVAGARLLRDEPERLPEYLGRRMVK
jgi:hypothetical protein